MLGHKKVRSGNANLALELLSVLMRDHRDLDGNFDPCDIDYLLHNDDNCKNMLGMESIHSLVVVAVTQQFGAAL